MAFFNDPPFEWTIGLRYTRASRRSARNSFISFISLISMAGIALGVAALIVVLSVMNGFQKEVRDRMLSVLSHVEVFDGSGSLQDWQSLAAQVKKNPEVRGAAPFADGQAMVTRNDAVRGVMDGIKTLAMGDKKAANSTGAVHQDKVEEKTTAADVIQFSGCRDDQTSADAVIDSQSTGAMSHAFIRALEQAQFKITYQDLLKNTREFLHQKYSQVPQMSAGRKLDMNVQFQL